MDIYSAENHASKLLMYVEDFAFRKPRVYEKTNVRLRKLSQVCGRIMEVISQIVEDEVLESTDVPGREFGESESSSPEILDAIEDLQNRLENLKSFASGPATHSSKRCSRDDLGHRTLSQNKYEVNQSRGDLTNDNLSSQSCTTNKSSPEIVGEITRDSGSDTTIPVVDASNFIDYGVPSTLVSKLRPITDRVPDEIRSSSPDCNSHPSDVVPPFISSLEDQSTLKKRALAVYGASIRKTSQTSRVGEMGEVSKLLNDWMSTRFSRKSNGSSTFRYDMKYMKTWVVGIVFAYGEALELGKRSAFVEKFEDWLNDVKSGHCKYSVPYSAFSFMKDLKSKRFTKTGVSLWMNLLENGLSSVIDDTNPYLISTSYVQDLVKSHSDIHYDNTLIDYIWEEDL